MEREDPRELELSLLALLDPVMERSSDGRLVLFPAIDNTSNDRKTVDLVLVFSPDSSARTAMTCLGSVLPPCPSLPLLPPPPPLSAEPEYLLNGLNGSCGAILIITGALPSLLPTFSLFLLVSLGSCLLVRVTTGSCPTLEYLVDTDMDKGDRPGSDRWGLEPSLT